MICNRHPEIHPVLGDFYSEEGKEIIKTRIQDLRISSNNYN